jgi:cysteine desulfurase
MESKPGKKRKIYMDHSATTPVRAEVMSAILPYFADKFGNASSIHQWGRDARKACETAREKVAYLLGCKPEEVIFTSGGTEADNLAIKGVAYANKNKGRHIITSSIEHHAVLHTCEGLEKEGFKVTYLPCDKYGFISPETIEDAIQDDTILITIIHGQNEIGTLQPLREIGNIARRRGIIFHSDAVQSAGKVPINVENDPVDLLTISSHKMYGPKGVGALYIHKGTRISPQLLGGAHERGLRAGTENIPGIVGFGEACYLAQKELKEESARLSLLRDKMIKGILENIPDTLLNGHPVHRLPHNVNISFKYIEGEAILLHLDLHGIAASSGSACTSGSLDPSHVLLATGVPHEIAHGSIRFTLGMYNTEQDVDYVLEVLPRIVSLLRDMSVYKKPVS